MAGQTDRPELFSGLREGALVLADISGYSTFVTQTEVDHSWSILHELLDTVVRSLVGRMEVSQVEGDAILFISGLSTPDVITALEGTFVAFHRRLRDMHAVTTCPCNACAKISVLNLKFVFHHGRFSRQRLDNVEAIPGARGEDLGAEFHCHHGGSVVSMRVVSLDPEREITLYADQPTPMYITTRLSDADGGGTKIGRSFIWEEPADPDVASQVRQLLEAVVFAGEGAIKSVFDKSE